MKLPKNYFDNLSNSKYREYLKMLPNMKEDNTRIITTLIFTFLAMSFFGVFAINPTITTIIELRKKLADSEMVQQRLETKINNLSSLQATYTGLESSLPVVMDAIPANAEAVLLVGQIQAMAKDTDLTVTSLRVSEVQLGTSKPINSSTATSFTFILEAEGTYQSMMQFITAITKASRIIVIDSVSINKAADSQALVLNLKGRQFFKAE